METGLSHGDVRRLEMIEVIQELTAEYGYPPSHAEVAERMDISPTAVRKHLVKLAEDGMVSYDPKRKRSLQVVKHVG